MDDDLSLMCRLAALMGWTVVGPELNGRAHYDFSGGDVYVDDAGSSGAALKQTAMLRFPGAPWRT